MRTLTIALVFLAVLWSSASAATGSKCDAMKLTQAGKALLCASKALAKGEQFGVPANAALDKCGAKFTSACTRIESKVPGCTAFLPVCANWWQGLTVRVIPRIEKRACVEAPLDVVAWWSLDEPTFGPFADLATALGYNTGLPHGAPVSVAGHVGNAEQFNGIADFIRAGTFLSSHDPTRLTVDAWVKRTSLGSGTVVRWLSNTIRGYDFIVDDTGVCLYDECGAVALPNCLPVGVPGGLWTHVAVTHQTAGGIGTTRIFVNGTELAASPVVGPGFMNACAGPGHWDIGGFSGSGALDEVEVHERVLTPAEIAGIYAAGPNGKCKEECP